MRCEQCLQADLRPEKFVYEREMPNGKVLRREVEGLACPNCGDRVLFGRDAEEISRDWFAVERETRGVPTRS